MNSTANKTNLLSHLSWKNIPPALGLFIILTLFSSIFNIGFIGSDEYTEGIARYLPAQNATWEKLSQPDDVKSPTQIATFHLITKALYRWGGVSSPELQYRSLILILGLMSALLMALSTWIFVSNSYSGKLYESLRPRLYQFIFLYFSFHFALIGLLARPMFESLSMSLVFLALSCAHAYDLKQNKGLLLLGVLAGSLAFCARPQTGIINLVFVLIPLLHRRWFDVLCAAGAGLIFFGLAGLPDLFIRGEFHYSLKAVFLYNLNYGDAYNPQPWWFYFPILFVVAGGFFLFARYAATTWLRILKMRSLWLGFILFMAVHILFKNKFERFLIPILPVFLLLIMPLWQELWQSRRQRKLRWALALTFNFLVWPIASFFTSQSNILDLCFYLNRHENIVEAQFDRETFNLFPEAFVERPLRIQFTNTSEILAHLSTDASMTQNPSSSHQYWILGKKDFLNWMQTHPTVKDLYVVEAQFHPNPIERLSFLLNPAKNLRRQTIFLIRRI